MRELQSLVSEKKSGAGSSAASKESQIHEEKRDEVRKQFSKGKLAKYEGTSAYDAAIEQQAKRKAEREIEDERERLRTADIERRLLEVRSDVIGFFFFFFSTPQDLAAALKMRPLRRTKHDAKKRSCGRSKRRTPS